MLTRTSLLLTAVGGFCLGLSCALAEPAADGLYAGFNTSHGQFWCRLEFDKVPRTVANFVSLAEGTRPWVDFQQPGIRQRPFYDGVKFHRVITGFMNQSGSPNGQGTDGPGYQFKDEFHPQLRHSKPGILSMANSGQNSNGSQFFVTVEPTPWLDNKHSVFGEVVEGYDAVTNINTIAGSASGAPKVTVTIHQVQILRRGAAATAFDPAAVTPSLPTVGGVLSSLKIETARLILSFPAEPARLYHVFFGPDLVHWQTLTFDEGPLDASPLLGLPQYYFEVLSGGREP
jgi:peptidyl-prolyl cis-trans isomerase A (cyclophilin A)